MNYPAGCTQNDVDRSSNGDEQIEEQDEVITLDCGHRGTLRGSESVGGKDVCEDCFNDRKLFIASILNNGWAQ
jgi:hypothetical protein